MENKKGPTRKLDLLKSKLSSVLTKRNQCILYVVTIIMAGLSIWNVNQNVLPRSISIMVYVCAAVSFFSSCPLWIRTVQLLVQVGLLPFVERNKIISIFIKDYRLRTIAMALPGLGMNLIFAIFNGVIGVISSSAGHGSLAAYYIILCIMRLMAVLYGKSIYIDKKDITRTEREGKVYRSCGFMLSIMSLALMGAVIMLVGGSGGKSYPGMLIYVVATYTFYKIVRSMVDIIKIRKENSLLLMTLKNIGLSEALVAVLSLQTALFAAFGGHEPDGFVPMMNALTGAAVCLIVLIMGIYMAIDGKKKLQLQIEK